MDNFKTVLGLVIGVISLAGILAGAIYYATDLKSKNDELRADLNDMSAKIAALEADLKATQSNVSAGLGAAMDSRNGFQDEDLFASRKNLDELYCSEPECRLHTSPLLSNNGSSIGTTGPIGMSVDAPHSKPDGAKCAR
ncbi:MAG: hypothetical protein AAF439_14695, partial [Pseudomonadota bacterium]